MCHRRTRGLRFKPLYHCLPHPTRLNRTEGPCNQ